MKLTSQPRIPTPHPVDVELIGTGKATKILATDEAAIHKLISSGALSITRPERFFMRIDEKPTFLLMPQKNSYLAYNNCC